MKHLLVAVGSVTIAALFSSCESQREPRPPQPSFAVRYHARDVDVWGPFADRITLQDIQQIRERIRARRDMREPLNTIHTLTENNAEVTSGIPWNMEKPFSYHMFVMRRDNGTWRIDPKTIKIVQGGGTMPSQGHPSFVPASD
jgi:hypothetical protein